MGSRSVSYHERTTCKKDLSAEEIGLPHERLRIALQSLGLLALEHGAKIKAYFRLSSPGIDFPFLTNILPQNKLREVLFPVRQQGVASVI